MGIAGKQQAKHPATGAGWAALEPPLRACGEIAGLRLANALSDALRLCADQLFNLGTQARTPREQEDLVDASGFVRSRRQPLVDAFQKHFEMAYLRACKHGPLAFAGSVIEIKPSQLRIIEHEMLEDSLDPQLLAEAIQLADWRALNELAVWFRQWLDMPQISPRDLPLGPRLLGAAVSDAIRDQLWRHEAKQRLIQVLPRFLPERVGQLYRDLAGQAHLLAGTSPAEPVAAPGISLPTQGKAKADRTGMVADPIADPIAALIANPMTDTLADAMASTISRPILNPFSSPSPSPVPSPISNATPASPPALPVADPVAEDVPVTPPPVTVTPVTVTPAPAMPPHDLARDEVLRHLVGRSLPRAIDEFLTGPWQVLLGQILVRQGADSREWTEAVETMALLVQTLTPGDAGGHTPGLPALMQRLRQGLETLGTSGDMRNSFFISLAECHGNIVAASRSRAPAPQVAPPAPAPRETAAARPPAPPAASAPAPAEASLEQLKTGVWMELREPDGDVRTLKLAWISAQRSLYLCTDRHGARARSLGAEELAALLREGRVRIVPRPDDARPQDRPAPGQQRNKNA